MITVGSTAAPAAVTISATNNGMVCGATETVAITATAPATGTLEWFKEGIRQTGLSGQTTINADLGKWFAAVTDGGCSSQKSNEITVSVSPSAGVALPDYTISGPNKVDAGDTKIYFATTASSQEGVNYLWTVTPGTTSATVAGSNTNNIVQVHFPTSGVASINLNVSNDCETAAVTNNDMDVVVGCTPASIYSYSPDSKAASTIEGRSAKLSIIVTGSQISYQWYSNGTNSNSGGTIITDATGSSYSTPANLAAGTYYFYCEISNCDSGSSEVSDVFTVTVTALSSMPAGSGSFTGRACFDVAQVNDGGDCGTLASRQAETLSANGARADFSQTITNTQTYTFTPSGTVSNVSFYAVEASTYTGQIIASLTPQADYSGTNISTAASVTIVYKNVNSLAAGKTTEQALTVDIYAVYNDAATGGGTDRTLKLTVSIKDCACCGAYAVGGTWLNFMCYNLGADPALATPAAQQAATPTSAWTNSDGVTTSQVYGNFYQWGNNLALSATAATENNWKDATTTTAGTPGYFSDDNAWGNSGAKSANDPCPAGWRVPSTTQWQSIGNGNSNNITMNTTGVVTTSGNKWTWKRTTTKGMQIGDFLFLPAAGRRSDVSDVELDGIYGYYWSRTPNGTIAYDLFFNSGVLSTSTTFYRYYAISVRCVVE